MRVTVKIGIIIASITFLVAITAPVLAVSDNANRVNAQNRPSVTPSRVQQATETKEAVKTKLENAKLKVCQNREKNINNIRLRIADRGQKQLELFTSISAKVQTFATEKGKQPENYVALQAEVTAKQAAAKTAVNQIKTSANVKFACDGSDPKGAAVVFKESLKVQIEALKAYKTAVKNLIVGVKSANVSATTTTTPSVSPTASPTPTQGAN